MNALKSGFKRLPSQPSLKDPAVAFWFGVSFIAPLYFGLISLFYATAFDHIVQDDARIHVVWLQRLTDPALFSDDPMAFYFGAIQPAGYKLLFNLVAALGIEPLTFAKFAPLILAAIATAYLFWVALMILPVPMAGVFTTLLLNQNIWIRDDLIATAPRSFIYPIFAAFLYYLLKDKKLFYLLALGILGLFYPQMMLVSLGVLTFRLIRWDRYRPSLPRRFRDYSIWLVAFIITGGLLLFFSGQVAHQVGRLTNLSEMKVWPEFQQDGRGEYFGVSLSDFLFTGSSGIRFPLLPPIILLGFLLPLALTNSRLQKALPLAARITPKVRILSDLTLSATGLFLLAHLIFPVLFLPSRYSFYSARFTLIIASGIMLTLVVSERLKWLSRQWRIRQWTLARRAKVWLSIAFAVAVVVTPAVPNLFLGGQGWRIGTTPDIFEFIARSPKDSLVASLVTEVNDNVPAFSERSVLVGREFALPFHVEFYSEMRQRAEDLVAAQYSTDLDVVQSFIEKYGIDIWIVTQNFAEPAYLDGQSWLLGSSVQGTIAEVKESMAQGIEPAIARTIPLCSTVTEANLVVLDAQCIARTTEKL